MTIFDDNGVFSPIKTNSMLGIQESTALAFDMLENLFERCQNATFDDFLEVVNAVCLLYAVCGWERIAETCKKEGDK